MQLGKSLRSKSRLTLWMAGLVAAALCAFVFVIAHAASTATAIASEAVLEDGTYTVQGRVLQATSSQSSMADGAFSQPMELKVSSDTQTLTVTVKPVTVSGLTAYLGWVKYYPEYTGTAIPKSISPTTSKVSTYYEVTDSFNDPETGTDPDMKGRNYVKKISFTMPKGTSAFFLQLYMPLMESIMVGGGTQYARMVLDLDSAQPKSAEEESDEEGASEDLIDCYQRLANYLSQAETALKKTSTYTASSLENLRTQRNAAQVIYEQGKASRTQVDDAIDNLVQALIDLKMKSSSTSKKSSSTSKSKTTTKLKFSKLADGTYHLTGRMVKLDKQTYSMADAGISHTVTLKVKNGRYYVIVRLKAVTSGSTTSYLGKLRYYTAGYKAFASKISGSTKSANVLSYQMKNGSRLTDDFGTNYPLRVRFELVSQAKSSGYVPLQVYIPAMEAIAKGTGTQQLYLKLDKTSISQGDASSEQASSASENSSTASSSNNSSSAASAGSSLGKNTLLAASDGSLAQQKDLTAASNVEDESLQADESQTAATDDEDKQPPLKGTLGPALAIILAVCLLAIAWNLFKKRRKLAKGLGKGQGA